MKAGPYSIGSDHVPGLSKLIEELGECGQVAGKVLGHGRFAWLLEEVRPFPRPIPAKGALGLWDWECSLNEMKQVGLTCPRAQAVIDRLQQAIEESHA